MVRYTIAICNLDMAQTLEPSLRSVLAQVDDRFEVLVVDDGSTDCSVDILERLDEEYDRLRVIPLPPDGDRKLGRTRTLSIEEAKGEHVLLHVDTDNAYLDSIPDFVEVYEQLRSQLGYEFYLLGTSFAMTERDFLLDFGAYRNLPVGGEDRDLWRRLAAADRLIYLDHEPVEQVAGWDYGGDLDYQRRRLRRTFEVKVADFQVGISFASYLAWSLEKPPHLLAYHVITSVICYVWAQFREQYKTPPEFRTKGAIDSELQARKMTLDEIELAYGVSIDRDRLSPTGEQLFDQVDSPNTG